MFTRFIEFLHFHYRFTRLYNEFVNNWFLIIFNLAYILDLHGDLTYQSANFYIWSSLFQVLHGNISISLLKWNIVLHITIRHQVKIAWNDASNRNAKSYTNRSFRSVETNYKMIVINFDWNKKKMIWVNHNVIGNYCKRFFFLLEFTDNSRQTILIMPRKLQLCNDYFLLSFWR